TGCTYTSVFQTIFCSPLVRLQPNLSYVQPDMHKPRPRKPSPLPPFRFFFHHPPQRPVDLPLIPRLPRNHAKASASRFRIQVQCHRLRRRPPPPVERPCSTL